VKVNLDDVACAGDRARQGGADVLASSIDAPRRGAAGLLHQGYSVAVLDCHVVVACAGGTPRIGTVFVLNLKCRELQFNNKSLLNFYSVCLPQSVWIIVGVIW